MPFFSILIPVYNVEKYLRECLDSIVVQNFTDYEVIMLDDGSVDSSGEICRQYAEAYENFYYYSQENKGLLLTRRRLFELMNGEYAICLDSDDYRLEGSLRRNYEDIIRSGCDLLIYRYNIVDDDGVFIQEAPATYEEEIIFEGGQIDNIIEAFIVDGTISTMWSKVIKRDLIDIDSDYSMYKDVKGEDVLQSIALFRNAGKIMYSPQKTVCYRSARNSRSNNFKFKYIKDLDRVFYQLYLFYLETNAGRLKRKRQFLHRYLLTQRFNIIPLMREKGNTAEKQKALETLREAQLMKVCKDYQKEKGSLTDRLLVSVLGGQSIKKMEIYFRLYGVLRDIKHILIKRGIKQ